MPHDPTALRLQWLTIMFSDSFSPLSPSDSGLLEGPVLPAHVSGSPRRAEEPRRPAPPVASVDLEDPETSLCSPPLPEGFLGRLRKFVDQL